MNNKRRRRKTVLDLNTGDSKNLDATSNKVKCPKGNGVFGNSLTHLLEQYNSDSDDDTPRTDVAGCLNEKVNDFLKEIQCIGSESDESRDRSNNKVVVNDSKEIALSQDTSSTSLWQECFDESTGYPYYWHTETNRVTWEKPAELKLTENNDEDINKKSPNRNPPRNILPSGNPCQYPDEKLMNTIPEGMIPKDIVARNRFKQVRGKSYSTKDKKKSVLDKRKKSEGEDEDSDDGRIEMITSFGSDNSDSDHSDDDKASSDNQKNIAMKIDAEEFQNHSANGVNCDDTDDVNTVADNSYLNEKNQSRNNIEQSKELAFSLVPGYADESDNEENCIMKRKIIDPIFPSATYENSQFKEQNSPVDPIMEESKCSEQLKESIDTINSDDTKNINKMDEAPKTNRFLENLGSSIKAFQRKKRIAFDVVMQKHKKSEGETSPRTETSKESTSILPITHGNDARHGLGFSNKVSFEDQEQTCDSPEEMVSSSVTTAEAKKDNLLGKSIGFVKGETLILTKKIDEPDRSAMTEDTQTIVEKLKFLSEGSPAATAVQIMNIQLQTLLAAWESGDLKDRYFSNWLMGTNRELCRLEKEAAPSGWNCQWDRSHKRYYYRNETNGETRWSYPDIIGGAEEMELCTTPPPPDMEEKLNDVEQDVMNENSERNQQIQDEQYGPQQQSNFNISGDSEKKDQHHYLEKDNSSDDNCQKDDTTVDKSVESRVSSLSPPPPPRISGDDLTRDRKKRRDAERQSDTVVKIAKKEEAQSDKIKENNSSDGKEINTIQTTEVIPTNCEPVITAAHHPHLLASNPTHVEPLPPGVDQPEMPYAIAATSLDASVIFPAAASQTNASIYAATMQDPTNISLIGHHHPALVQNQLVHYPAYHPHLQNQAIIAAANRLAGPDTVQFMLDYTRIYANTQVIAKPPVKTAKEPMGTVLDSFYNDIASLENHPVVDESQQIKHSDMVTPVLLKPQEPSITALVPPAEIPNTTTDPTSKDKKKKKVKIVISKKQKQVSSMVAKWKKAQNYEGTN